MVVKIIKQGKLPEEETFERTCGHCNTVFSYQKKDTKSVNDAREYYNYIECPFCHRHVTHQSSATRHSGWMDR